tara:strand:- start:36 stop:638 length:603 start_codon:yes stop_codon:yes gene_type:complete
MTIKLIGSSSGSVSLQAPASTSGGANRVLTLPDANGTVAVGDTGKILQVKQAVKTDTASSNTATFADLSGLSLYITPASTSSKILVSCNLHVSGRQDSFQAFKVFRDSTAIGLGTAGTGNQTNASFATQCLNTGSAQYGLRTGNFEFLDTPSTTSQITYKIQWASVYQSYTSYINRPYSVNNQTFNTYASSSITLYEVAA